MRKVIFSLLTTLLIFSLSGCVIHTVPSTTVTKVISLKEKQKELYVKANNWMAETFKNSKSVIQFRDKESGTITGRYLLGTVMIASQQLPAQYVYAIIKIQVKDGASKITLKPESFRYAEGNPSTLYTEENANTDIKELISSFQIYMQNQVDNKW